MAHARQQIRDLVVTTLTGLTLTGSNVYAGQQRPTHASELPGLWVWTSSDETVGVKRTTNGTLEVHELTVMVEVRAFAATSVDDLVDDICEDVQVAIYADQTLGGVVREMQLEAFELELETEAEQAFALGTMSWSLEYRVAGTDPSTIVS